MIKLAEGTEGTKWQHGLNDLDQQKDERANMN